MLTWLFCNLIVMPALLNSIPEGEKYMRFRRERTDRATHPLLQTSSGGVHGVDPGREAYRGNGHRPVEGFSTGGREGFKDFISADTAVDALNKKDRIEVRKVEDDYNRSLSNFSNKTRTLMADARDYVGLTAPGANPYARRIIFDDQGHYGYVTKYGEFRALPDYTTKDNMMKRPGCSAPMKVDVAVPDASAAMGSTVQLPGLTAPIFVGPPIPSPYGIPCGLEGENVQMTMMADAPAMWSATKGSTVRSPRSVETGMDDLQGGDEMGCLECTNDGLVWCWKDRNCYEPGAQSPCAEGVDSCVSAKSTGVYKEEKDKAAFGIRELGSFGGMDRGACEEKCQETPFCGGATWTYKGDAKNTCTLWDGGDGISVVPNPGSFALSAPTPCKTSSCGLLGAQAQAGDYNQSVDSDGMAADVDLNTDPYIGCVRDAGEQAYQSYDMYSGNDATPGIDSPSDRGVDTGDSSETVSGEKTSSKALHIQQDLGGQVTREQCFTRALDIQAGAFGLGNATAVDGTARGTCYTTDHRTRNLLDPRCGDPTPGIAGAYTESKHLEFEVMEPSRANKGNWIKHGDSAWEGIQYGVTRNGRFVGASAPWYAAFEADMTTGAGMVAECNVGTEGSCLAGGDGRVQGDLVDHPNSHADGFDRYRVFWNADGGAHDKDFKGVSSTNGGAFVPGTAEYKQNDDTCNWPGADATIPQLPDPTGLRPAWYNQLGYPDQCFEVAGRAGFDGLEGVAGLDKHNACSNTGLKETYWWDCKKWKKGVAPQDRTESDCEEWSKEGPWAVGGGSQETWATFYRRNCPVACNQFNV